MGEQQWAETGALWNTKLQIKTVWLNIADYNTLPRIYSTEDLNQINDWSLIPNLYSKRRSNISCSTVSKAALNSRNTNNVTRCLFMLTKKSLRIRSKADSVLWFLRWLIEIPEASDWTRCDQRFVVQLPFQTFSVIFERHARLLTGR